MSLIGSLEDLNLGDILQIIYLSQKSGALVIRSGEGEGRILFREGLVCGGVVKGGPADLRALLVGSGAVVEADFNSIADEAGSADGELEAQLLAKELIDSERLDSLRRDSIETAVAVMFRWSTGEFSFDLTRDSGPESSELMLSRGINPQFLAMERVRLEDESGRSGEADFEHDDEQDDPDEMSAEEMFGVVTDRESAEEADPIHVMAMKTTELVDSFDSSESRPELAEVGSEVEAEPAHPGAALEVPAPDVPQTPEVATLSAPAQIGPLVVIDPDLGVLEWVKKTLKADVAKIHIFQRSDLGLNRIRQYLARATSPTVLVSPLIPGDPATGIADAADFVRRLKAQAQNMTVLWLWEDGTPAPGFKADGVLTRPASRVFQTPAAAGELATMASALRELLTSSGPLDRPHASASRASGADGVAPISGDDARDLEAIAQSLREASSRGEILPLVIRHARESFSRVAMFMVRDDVVMGMAQSGLDACGGPDDHGMLAINFEGDSSSWLRRVLMTRRPLSSGAEDQGDRDLALRLGDRVPSEAYLAPIESDGHVVAVLYADNLPGDGPIGDTACVEVATHHAGLALAREVRERTGETEG